MLSRYKKSYRKIAMGLLSLAVKEKELKSLQQLMDQYENDPHHQLYIWKENGRIVGVMGVIKRADDFIVHHLAVMPSYSKEEIGEQMKAALEQISRFEKMRIASETDAAIPESSAVPNQPVTSGQAIS